MHDCLVYYIVGPCAGKTTTVARLRTFFENLGWKVKLGHDTAHAVVAFMYEWGHWYMPHALLINCVLL